MKQQLRQVLKRLGAITILLAAVNALAAAAEPAPCAEIYIVQTNDWLSKIADKFLGEFEAYPAIITATNQQHQIDDSFALIANPDQIEAGWKLCVPVTTEAEAILTEVSQPDHIANLAMDLLDSPPTISPQIYTLDSVESIDILT